MKRTKLTKYPGIRTAVAIALVLLIGEPVRLSQAQSHEVGQIDRLLEELKLDQAAEAIDIFEGAHPESAEALYLRSRLLFFGGEYEAAMECAELAVDSPNGLTETITTHRDLVAATLDSIAGFAHHRTSLGHFIISYDPNQDNILLPYADETLERAYAEIGFDFGYWPRDTIRVLIYPRANVLAEVSELTEEAIETSGTVALCKYNRLMITSPRALVQGYGWRDTLSHEYVHLVIQHLTGTRVPIWLHEGMAKFEERRWRGYHERLLPPSNQDLLARRLEVDDLVSFDQMHPSMAFLPSQEDTATAFAEVYTVVEHFYQGHGVEGLRELIGAISRGANVETAFEQVTGLPFERYLSRWEEYMHNRPYQSLPSEYVPALQYMPDEASEAPPDELAGIAQEEARNYMHLGQLLRARGRIDASIAEYRKAESLVGQDNPVFQNRLARALLDSGRNQEAIDSLGEAAEYYPEYYLTFLHLGEAYMNLGRPEIALDNLFEAIAINPFDPEVHRQLSRVYRSMGESSRAEQAASFAHQTSR